MTPHRRLPLLGLLALAFVALRPAPASSLPAPPVSGPVALEWMEEDYPSGWITDPLYSTFTSSVRLRTRGIPDDSGTYSIVVTRAHFGAGFFEEGAPGDLDPGKYGGLQYFTPEEIAGIDPNMDESIIPSADFWTIVFLAWNPSNPDPDDVLQYGQPILYPVSGQTAERRWTAGYPYWAQYSLDYWQKRMSFNEFLGKPNFDPDMYYVFNLRTVLEECMLAQTGGQVGPRFFDRDNPDLQPALDAGIFVDYQAITLRGDTPPDQFPDDGDASQPGGVTGVPLIGTTTSLRYQFTGSSGSRIYPEQGPFAMKPHMDFGSFVSGGSPVDIRVDGILGATYAHGRINGQVYVMPLLSTGSPTEGRFHVPLDIPAPGTLEIFAIENIQQTHTLPVKVRWELNVLP